MCSGTFGAMLDPRRGLDPRKGGALGALFDKKGKKKTDAIADGTVTGPAPIGGIARPAGPPASKAAGTGLQINP